MTTLAIDLGTVNVRFAIIRDGIIKVLNDEVGNKSTPNCVAFTPNERLIGDAAKSQMPMNATNSVYDLKRLIGRKYCDIQLDIGKWPFKVLDTSSGDPIIELNVFGETKQLTPVELVAMILNNVKKTVEETLSETIEKVVITVPTYFSSAQRQATKDAAIVAGFKGIRLVNETTAAALYYGFEFKKRGTEFVFFYHLGAGCFNVSIIEITDGSHFKVLAAGGDCNLGGIDFDNCLAEYFVTEFERQHNVKISDDPRAMRRLRNACEEVKKVLTTNTETSISVNNLHKDIDLQMDITRAKFEELCYHHFVTTFSWVQQVLANVNLPKVEIDEVFFIGGSTRIPFIVDWMQNYFGAPKMNYTINAEVIVVNGATLLDSLPQLSVHEIHPLAVYTSIGKVSWFKTFPPQWLSKTEDQVNVVVDEGDFVSSFSTEYTILTPDTVFEMVYDQDGILSFSTESKRSFPYDINQMIEDSKGYLAKDEENKKKKEARVKLEDFLLLCEKYFFNYKVINNKIKEIINSLQQQCAETMTWLKGNRFAQTTEFNERLKQIQIPFFKFVEERRKQREISKKILEDYVAAALNETRVLCPDPVIFPEVKINSEVESIRQHLNQSSKWITNQSSNSDAEEFDLHLKDLKSRIDEPSKRHLQKRKEAINTLNSHVAKNITRLVDQPDKKLSQKDIKELKTQLTVELQMCNGEPFGDAKLYKNRLLEIDALIPEKIYQKNAAKTRLKECLEYFIEQHTLLTDHHHPESSLVIHSTMIEMKQKCSLYSDWLNNCKINEDEEEFTNRTNDLMSCYDKLIKKKVEDRESSMAKLKKYIEDEVLSRKGTLNDTKDTNMINFLEKCDSKSKWLATSPNGGSKVFEDQLKQLQSDKDLIDKQKIAALQNFLETKQKELLKKPEVTELSKAGIDTMKKRIESEIQALKTNQIKDVVAAERRVNVLKTQWNYLVDQNREQSQKDAITKLQKFLEYLLKTTLLLCEKSEMEPESELEELRNHFNDKANWLKNNQTEATSLYSDQLDALKDVYDKKIKDMEKDRKLAMSKLRAAIETERKQRLIHGKKYDDITAECDKVKNWLYSNPNGDSNTFDNRLEELKIKIKQICAN